jgi:demethylmenaquinone methyltransferase/2-methoxy-6-polyprenyl-1,4-benzoquinol methylase
MKATYNFYFRHALPWIGSLFDGSRDSYRYLNRTVETFPARDDFIDLMRAAGFTDCRFETWTFGVIALYRGRKPAP